MSEIDRDEILATLIKLDDKDKSFMLGYAVGACKAAQDKEARKNDSDRPAGK